MCSPWRSRTTAQTSQHAARPQQLSPVGPVTQERRHDGQAAQAQHVAQHPRRRDVREQPGRRHRSLLSDGLLFVEDRPRGEEVPGTRSVPVRGAHEEQRHHAHQRRPTERRPSRDRHTQQGTAQGRHRSHRQDGGHQGQVGLVAERRDMGTGRDAHGWPHDLRDQHEGGGQHTPRRRARGRRDTGPPSAADVRGVRSRPGRQYAASTSSAGGPRRNRTPRSGRRSPRPRRWGCPLRRSAGPAGRPRGPRRSRSRTGRADAGRSVGPRRAPARAGRPLVHGGRGLDRRTVLMPRPPDRRRSACSPTIRR